MEFWSLHKLVTGESEEEEEDDENDSARAAPHRGLSG